MDIETHLAHAVTRYDRAQARSRHYNPHGLGIMLRRCEEIAAEVARGVPLQQAIREGFNDRLRDRVLIYMRDHGFPVAPER